MAPIALFNIEDTEVSSGRTFSEEQACCTLGHTLVLSLRVELLMRPRDHIRMLALQSFAGTLPKNPKKSRTQTGTEVLKYL